MSAVSPLAPEKAATISRDTLVVRERHVRAAEVVEFVLSRPDGSRLPDWAAGSHIDLVLPDGTVRQYSLCGDRWDASVYRVAVQREVDGRGGSTALHDRTGEGALLGFGGPRNNFRLAPAEEYLFVAGGIGITPIIPMIRQADMLGVPWRLLYLGRSRSCLAYLDELALYGDRVDVHCSDERGRADLEAWRPADPRIRVYACGPNRLLDAIAGWGAVPGGFPPKMERFTVSDEPGAGQVTEFEVVAKRAAVRTVVARSESVVDALRRVGVDVITSCGQGVCGTCETDVLEGRPDHRDSLLDDEERTSARYMYPCVSRCRDSRLVLDL